MTSTISNDFSETFAKLRMECEHSVEEIAQLLRSIEDWQVTRRTQNEATFDTPESRVQNKSYLQQIEVWLNSLVQRFITLTTEVLKHFAEGVAFLKNEFPRLDEEIGNWKSEQRICLIGGPADTMNEHLRNLRQRFEQVEGFFLSLEPQLARYSLLINHFLKLFPPHETNKLPLSVRNSAEDCFRIREEIKNCMAALVQKSFIVYEQPPAIVRRGGMSTRTAKNSKVPFSLEIGFLAGQKFRLLKENSEVKVGLITQDQAKDIVEGKTDLRIEFQGMVHCPVWSLQTMREDSNFCMSARVSDVRIQKIDKSAEDDSSRAMYHLLFRIIQKPIATESFTYYPFWAISLPFSVTMNASRQDKYKSAITFWQMAFLTDDKTSLSKTLYETPVRWDRFFEALNFWFKSFGKTMGHTYSYLNRGLEDHEYYIKEKIGCINDVTWDMFYKAKVSPSFWEWIYSTADYVSQNGAYWDSGFLLGFASRKDVEQILKASSVPAIIIKFSESRPGKLVVSYVNWIDLPGKVIEHVIFDPDDDPVFTGKSLVDCIRMSPKLKHTVKVLPIDKPIEELFALENHNAKKADRQYTSDGYVKPSVCFVWEDAPDSSDFTNESPLSSQNQKDTNETDSSNLADMVSSTGNYPALQKWLNQNNYSPGRSMSSVEGSDKYDFTSPPPFQLQLSPQQDDFECQASPSGREQETAGTTVKQEAARSTVKQEPAEAMIAEMFSAQ